MQCSHCGWEKEFAPAIKSQTNRKKVLQNTVNKVFDFGLVDNWFGSERRKSNSFAALLYYSHILSDYLADDPSETEVSVNGKMVSAYAGKPYVVLNGNKPSFTTAQMKSTESFAQFSPLDGLGRAGVALASIGYEKLPSPGSREGNVSFNPSGWNQKNYQEIIGSEKDSGNVYERCHLIAYMLGGEDHRTNVITGTRYLNKTGMLPFEKTIEQYIRNTNHHVLYRVTPIYKGDNKLASGVQLEAYSVEDKGRGICYNVYCYNVQPGIDINYTNGENGKADLVTGNEGVLPFAVNNPTEQNRDLLFEMDKHLAIILEDQRESSSFTQMKEKLDSVAAKSRSVSGEKTSAQNYRKLKEYQYEYYEYLKAYLPLLLKKEKFFTSVFK